MFLRLWACLPACSGLTSLFSPCRIQAVVAPGWTRRWDGPIADSVAAVSLRKSGLDVAHGNRPLGGS